MSSSIPSSSAPVKRACDRKVKCIGEGTNPCKNCQSAGLACTYNAIPQKKGPKGSRAKVLSELRETQRQSQLAPGVSFDVSGLTQRSISPAPLARTTGLLTNDLVGVCAEFYLTNLYPSLPLLHHQRIREAFMAMDQSVEMYAMVCSLCAHVMLQPNFLLPPTVRLGIDFAHLNASGVGQMLLEETLRARKGYEYYEISSLDSVSTSFFIYCAFSLLNKHDAAWYFLREALTLAMTLRLHDEESYKADDFITASRKKRAFWVLFIAERIYTFKKARPLTLKATVQPPVAEEDPTDHINLAPFAHLIELFRPFDETFFALWFKQKGGVSPAWLIQLQTHLSTTLPSFLDGTETQLVDLRITQLWLKTMVWQLSITHGFVATLSQDPTLSFRFPIDIARELVQLSNDFAGPAMKTHGIGLIEKLFDIACTLLDVISYSTVTPDAYEADPQEYLTRIISLINGLRGDRTRFITLLAAKVSETLPNYQTPVLAQSTLYAARSSSSSTPATSDGTPFESASPYGVRQHAILQGSPSSMHYPSTGGYAHYGGSMPYDDATSAMAAASLYQTHTPPGGRRGYPG